MGMKERIVNELLTIFNCNIDYEQLKVIYKNYEGLDENSKVNVLNYPLINNLITNQEKRKKDFTELVDKCLSEGVSSKYGLIHTSEKKVYVVELTLQEFEDSELLEEYYKNFIL